MGEPENSNKGEIIGNLDAMVAKKLKQAKELINKNKTLTFLFLVIIVVPAFIIIVVSFTIHKVNWIGFGEDSNQATTIEYELDTRKETIDLEEIRDPKNDKKPLKGKIVKITKKDTDNFQQFKTLWDWLQLGGVLAIPIALYYFERSEQRRSEKRNQSDQRRLQELNELEKERAAKIQREESLENYISQISQLLIDTKFIIKIQKFIKNVIDSNKKTNEGIKKIAQEDYDALIKEIKKENTEIYCKIIDFLNKDAEISVILDIIRARTLSILRKLEEDGDRKGEVIRFLIDVEIVDKLDLNNADLRYAKLKFANLNFIKLAGAKLNNANLVGAKLNNANLNSAELNDAELNSAELNDAELNSAELNNTNLNNAELNHAKLNSAELNHANLLDAKLNHADLFYAKLNHADLSGAELNKANLSGAELNHADLVDAKLNNAELFYAKLNHANLFGAQLNEANLSDAELNHADLTLAELNNAQRLKVEQVKKARQWEEAKYDKDFYIELVCGDDE